MYDNLYYICKLGDDLMKKDRGGRIFVVIALLIGVIGLTVGFASFSNNLSIGTEANYHPDDSIFNVAFSAVSTGVSAGAEVIVPTVSGTNNPMATSGSISNSGDPTISNISVTFSEPGQSVVYEFYVKNIGQMKAFLRSITFSDASVQASGNGDTTNVGTGFKTCSKVTTGGNASTMTTMAAACDDISLSLRFANGLESYNSNKVRTGTDGFGDIHDLDVSDSEKVTLTITYDSNGDRADGDFVVNFGDITFVYASTEASE